jgi:hypothetical protein
LGTVFVRHRPWHRPWAGGGACHRFDTLVACAPSRRRMSSTSLRESWLANITMRSQGISSPSNFGMKAASAASSVLSTSLRDPAWTKSLTSVFRPAGDKQGVLDDGANRDHCSECTILRARNNAETEAAQSRIPVPIETEITRAFGRNSAQQRRHQRVISMPIMPR